MTLKKCDCNFSGKIEALNSEKKFSGHSYNIVKFMNFKKNKIHKIRILDLCIDREEQQRRRPTGLLLSAGACSRCLSTAAAGAVRVAGSLYTENHLPMVWRLFPQSYETIIICTPRRSRVVSVMDSGAEGPGFKSQPRRCRVTVLGKLFTSIVPLFTKQQNR